MCHIYISHPGLNIIFVINFQIISLEINTKFRIYIYIYIYIYLSTLSLEYIYIYIYIYLYRVSQEEWTELQESVPYVKIYWYNPKHLYLKLNGYGDNGQRKVWASGVSTYKYIYIYIYIYLLIQGVPGGMDKTSGECSLC